MFTVRKISESITKNNLLLDSEITGRYSFGGEQWRMNVGVLLMHCYFL